MRIVVQKSLNSSVIVENKIVGSISNGLVLLVAFKIGDTINEINYMVKKVLNLRIFEDENGVMNKSLLDVGGSVLSISQFTLYGDASNGNRPSYILSMSALEASQMYDLFNKELSKHVHVETGIFQTDMVVNITNLGPTTIILEK